MKGPILIAIASNKGGTGKSTLAAGMMVNLSAKGFYVLGLSLDSQGDLETILKTEIPDSFPDISEQLQNDGGKIHGYRVGSLSPAYLVPSSTMIEMTPSTLAGVGVDFVSRFTDKIKAIEKRDYQYVIIDCPPALNDFTRAAITVADYVIIPMIPVPMDIKGTCRMIEYANAISDSQGLKSKVLGILYSIDEHYKINEETKDYMQSTFPNLPFVVTIRKTIAMEESVLRGLFHPLSRNGAAKDYGWFVEELLERLDNYGK